MPNLARALLLSLLLLICPTLASGQPAPPAYAPPDDISFRQATVVSEGTRMAAEVFAPMSARPDERLPTVIMSHGWGGVASQLRDDAAVFARAGYLVVTFDYRGWGASEGRLILTKPAPAGREPGAPFTAEVKEVREVVDPLDQTTDLLNVLHWVHGEPQCDPQRIGLWGSSYSGGHVVHAAARDPRVRALVAQVPALDSRWVLFGPGRAQTLADATKRARGEIGYPQPGAVAVGSLVGAPIRERLMLYHPVDDVEDAPNCAMLFILAEREELFDNADHGVKAHARAPGPKKLVTIPDITHYGIYQQARPEAQRLAIEWYDEHLKGAATQSDAQ